MEHIEKYETKISDLKFENKDEFEFIVITQNKIDNYDFNDPGYITKLINEDFTQIIKTTPENFIENIGKSLKVDYFDEIDSNVITHILCDKPEYLYEILLLDIQENNQKEEYENQFATLINIYGEKIYGNMIILKTYIDNDSDKMVFDNMTKKDLFDIIDTRVNSQVVIYEDGEWRNDRVRGDMEIFCKNLFDEEYVHYKEFPFLLHNINIAYCKSEFGDVISPKLLDEKVEIAIFYTMNSDKYRGNLTLDEVKKIITLSEHLEDYKPNTDWLKEEKDSYDRKIIKNKYKILNFAWKEYLKKSQYN